MNRSEAPGSYAMPEYPSITILRAYHDTTAAMDVGDDALCEQNEATITRIVAEHPEEQDLIR
jgi:hypothetical protein